MLACTAGQSAQAIAAELRITRQTDTLETTPRNATHWTTRSLAKQAALSHSTIRPHLARVRAAAAAQE